MRDPAALRLFSMAAESLDDALSAGPRAVLQRIGPGRDELSVISTNKPQALGEEGGRPMLFAAVRSDMLEAPCVRDFPLTAKDISFATLEGVNAVSAHAV